MAKLRLFDPKCYELAKCFLADHPELNKEIFWEELAADIQQEIEESIELMLLIRAATALEKDAEAENKV